MAGFLVITLLALALDVALQVLGETHIGSGSKAIALPLLHDKNHVSARCSFSAVSTCAISGESK